LLNESLPNGQKINALAIADSKIQNSKLQILESSFAKSHSTQSALLKVAGLLNESSLHGKKINALAIAKSEIQMSKFSNSLFLNFWKNKFSKTTFRHNVDRE